MKKIKVYIDEVGRWPLAWPVTVWLVVTKARVSFRGYKDSKKCSARLREQLTERIHTDKRVLCVTAKSTHAYIDTHGMTKAIHMAIHKGLEKLLDWYTPKTTRWLKNMIAYIGYENIELIIDGNHDFHLRKKLWIAVKTIIRWDDTVPQISMASIVAKVERDGEMVKYHKKYTIYGFDKHKWYGTLSHRKAIKKHGPCKIHRKSFLSKII